MHGYRDNDYANYSGLSSVNIVSSYAVNAIKIFEVAAHKHI